MNKILLFVACVCLGSFCIGAVDCEFGPTTPTGKGCQSGEDCPENQSCSLKTNTCVDTYGNDNMGDEDGN